MSQPKTESLAVVPDMPAGMQAAAPLSALQILEAAVRGGVTSENVAVVKEIMAMRREEVAAQNKVAFNRAFFELKREIANLNIHCDSEAKNESGRVMYRFCSETEISDKLEPVLFRHGFAMLFGQRQENERVVAEITLIHESGHEEKREYAVRMGSTNRAKDATQADAGSTTSAWRHLVIKLFGLKSRIREDSDAYNEGSFITAAQAASLRTRVAASGADEARFLKFAGATAYEQISSARLPSIEAEMTRRERTKPAPSTPPTATPQAALGAILDAAGYTFDEFRRWAEAEGQWPDASSASTLYECPAKVAQTMVTAKAGLLAGLAELTGRKPK